MINFIHEQFLDDLSLCDDIIAYAEMTPHKLQGKTGRHVDLTVKKSIDCELKLNEGLYKRYIKELDLVVKKYIEKFEYCNKYAPWGVTEGVNIQHYSPGDGYYAWHSERVNTMIPDSYRHLVFLTYLNDVNDEGETEFFYQKVKIKPRKGLTVVWPTDWTHTHRGISSKTEDKFIVTGWFSYMDSQPSPMVD